MHIQPIKRVVDIILAGGGIFAGLPIIIIAGFAIKFDSPGPVYYRSRRVGRGGREFDLLKLRTMAISQETNAPQVTSATDLRITRMGKWLRRSKIDELPQLLNVLRGDVSLVGPRPEAPKYVAMFPTEYKEILTIRPGLSDRATLLFVNEEAILAGEEDVEQAYINKVLPRKIEIYLEYVRNPSLLEDFKIIYETATQVVKRTISTMKE